jgi:MoaA/NifB/PqqE/SkfB family radical SAM enzyme
MSKGEVDLNQGISGGKYSRLKLAWFHGKLESFLTGKITAPIYVRVKPTNKCSHNCFYCVYEPSVSGIHERMNREDEIPREKMLEVISDFSDMGVKAVTFSGGGEPLGHPNICEIMEQALRRGIDLSVITNGQHLSGERAELLGKARWVRASIDYCDEETFTRSRRRPKSWFDKVVSNVRGFVKTKDEDCALGVNFVVHEHNFNRIVEAARFLRDLGVDNLRFGPLWMPGFEEYHAPFKDTVIEQIERAKQDFKREGFDIGDTYKRDFELTGTCERRYPRCYYAQVVPAIGADGVVYFCHNKAYDSSGEIGSIMQRSFRDLWFSEETARRLKELNPQASCKHQCTNDEKNLIYHELVACGDPKVVNFV